MSYFPPLNTGWELIGFKSLNAIADFISVENLPYRHFLHVILHTFSIGNTIVVMQFNNDAGARYARRISVNGGADATLITTTRIVIKGGGAEIDTFAELSIQNHVSREKQVLGWANFNPALGPANVPSRAEIAGKWANSQDGINKISIINEGTGDFDVGSDLVVLGFGRA